MSNNTGDHFLAGCMSGIVADGAMHPIDTVRARLQTQQDKAYRNMVDAFRKIVRTEGVVGLYKGVGLAVGLTGPAHALYFAGYEFAKRRAEKFGAAGHFAAGAFANATGALLWVPMDVAKQRLQVQRGDPATFKYRGNTHALYTIAREEGVRGLYKGFGAAFATYGPFSALYFTIYEWCKKEAAHVQQKKPDELGLATFLVSGFTAGGAAAAMTTPLDVVKTRLQVQHSGSNLTQYKGIGDACRTMLQREGPRAFFSGIGARTAWIAPGSALTIALYEEFKKLLQ